LEAVFSAPVIEGYRMTECYPITSNPVPPGKRVPGSAGTVASSEVVILDDNGRVLPSVEPGEIAVYGAQLTSGYLDEKSDNEDLFVGRWFKTGDIGYMDQEGYLFVTGRSKEIINRGGEKISPREIDEVLLAHAAVAEAVTYPVRHPSLGEDVAAAVVLRENVSSSAEEIKNFASERLAPYKVPRQLMIVKELPKTGTGKIQRRIVAERIALERRATPQTEDPRAQTATEIELARIWRRVLKQKHVGMRDNFFESGGDSLSALQLLTWIERKFGKSFPPSLLLEAATIEKLAGVITGETQRQHYYQLVPIRPKGSRTAFFWVHGDASNALLKDYLHADQPFFALTHQSQDGRRALYTSVKSIARWYIEQIRAVRAKGPYLVGGFSFGGTVAFEMAQQLSAMGEQVSLVIMLDSQFSGTVVPALTRYPSLRGEIRRHLNKLARLTLRDKITYVGVRLQKKIIGKLSETGGRINRNVKEVISNVYLSAGRPLPTRLRTRYLLNIYQHAARSYVPEPYGGRGIYIKSATRPLDHQLNWQRLFTIALEAFEVPGNHLDLIKEPYAAAWASKLQDWLDSAQKICEITG
jgi:oxalate---CoA ligase